MITLTNNIIEPIVDACFTDDEKRALEVVVKDTVLSSVSHQFMYYFGGYCYRHDVDRLKSDIALIKEENIDILERLKNIRETITMLLDPYKYNKVIITDRSSASNSDFTNVSKRKLSGDSTHTESTINNDSEVNLANVIGQGASSQTNITGATEEILKPIDVSSKPSDRKKIIVDKDNSYKISTESVPEDIIATIGKANVSLPFTNSTISQEMNIIHNNSYTDTSNAYRDKESNTELNSNVNIGVNNSVMGSSMLVNTENENRIKLLSLELPKLRCKFFKAFSPIFYHARLR